MINQHEFIESCLIKYRYQQIPEGVEWNDAHYPEPKCKNGIETVPLWKSDHAAHNVIQSEELGYPCIWGWELGYLVGEYGYLVPYFHKWKSILGKQAAAKAKEMGAGIYAPGMKSLGGKATLEMGVGIFDESRRGEYQEVRKKNGAKAKEQGLGIFAEGQQSLGGKVTQEKKLGLFGLPPEDKKEAERKGGRTAGKLPRWTNGIINRYCTEQPGPDWYPGVTRKKNPTACEA
jgi:hypothetical protein